MSSNTQLKKEIIKAASNIRKKYKSIKSNIQHENKNIENIFKPVTEKLNDLSTKVIEKIPSDYVKKEDLDLHTKYKIIPVRSSPSPLKRGDSTFNSPLKQQPAFLPNETIVEDNGSHGDDNTDNDVYDDNDDDNDDDEVFEPRRRKSMSDFRKEVSDLQKMNSPVLQEYLNQYPSLTKQYIIGYIHDTENDYDTTYGVRFFPKRNKWYLGNKEIIFDKDSNIIVNNQAFTGTEGLYELLFKTRPIRSKITVEDEEKYRDILNITSAHRRDYDPNKQIRGSILPKYNKYIKIKSATRIPNQKSCSGTGMLASVVYNNKPIEYVYWDDPNEMVDRMRLLMASTRAGNGNHQNEIMSIIEELKERHIIA